MRLGPAGRLVGPLWAAVVILTGLSILTTLGIVLARSGGLVSRLRDAPFLVFLAALATVGAVIAARRPRNAVGWLFSAAGLLMSLGSVEFFYAQHVLEDPGVLPGGVIAAWLRPMLEFLGVGLIATFVLLLFPDGKLPSPRWRPLAWLSGAVLAAITLATAVRPQLVGPGYSVDNPLGVRAAQGLAHQLGEVVFLLVPLCLASLVVRFRRSRGEERQQLKWLTYAAALLALVGLASMVGLRPTQWVNDLLFGIAFPMIPIAAGVAILKYRLYAIDVVISKTVVFAGLAGFITVVYVGIVVGVGGLVGAGGEPNLGLSVAATAVVAVAFGPVRERVQRLANRLVYGVRATPYEVLSAFSARLGDTVESDQLLARMARLLAQGTGARQARVWLRLGGHLRPTAVFPTDAPTPGPLALPDDTTLPGLPGADAVAPVVHHGDLLGALTVTKARGETLTPADEALIGDLAAQAGLVLRNVGLTAELMQRLEELRASRQRLVAAQDSERRRLERDLHDGAQQQLVALKIKLALAKTIAAREHADRAAQILETLAGDTDDAIATLRDLARGIYPPLLADQGLAAALAAQAAKAPLPVTVHADGTGRYPQDTEAAVYFCCLEALQNTTKYARATHATITLTDRDGQLTFTITDDGVGFDPATTTRGSGLQNMADRLDAHGGSLAIHSTPGAGTKITGRLPANTTLPTPVTSGTGSP